MRIKELFTVAEGEKVTEKTFGRVLISSVCSIVLCMACLVGSTWAWFAVDIENKGNEIQIATVTSAVTVLKGNEEVPRPGDGAYTLEAGTYNIRVQVTNDATAEDDLNKMSALYVSMVVTHDGKSECYYFTFNGSGVKELKQFKVASDEAKVSFALSWIQPVEAFPLADEAVVIGEATEESTTESSTETTAATETSENPETTAATETTEASETTTTTQETEETEAKAET